MARNNATFALGPVQFYVQRELSAYANEPLDTFARKIYGGAKYTGRLFQNNAGRVTYDQGAASAYGAILETFKLFERNCVLSTNGLDDSRARNVLACYDQFIGLLAQMLQLYLTLLQMADDAAKAYAVDVGLFQNQLQYLKNDHETNLNRMQGADQQNAGHVANINELQQLLASEQQARQQADAAIVNLNAELQGLKDYYRNQMVVMEPALAKQLKEDLESLRNEVAVANSNLHDANEEARGYLEALKTLEGRVADNDLQVQQLKTQHAQELEAANRNNRQLQQQVQQLELEAGNNRQLVQRLEIEVANQNNRPLQQQDEQMDSSSNPAAGGSEQDAGSRRPRVGKKKRKANDDEPTIDSLRESLTNLMPVQSPDDDRFLLDAARVLCEKLSAAEMVIAYLKLNYNCMRSTVRSFQKAETVLLLAIDKLSRQVNTLAILGLVEAADDAVVPMTNAYDEHKVLMDGLIRSMSHIMSYRRFTTSQYLSLMIAHVVTDESAFYVKDNFQNLLMDNRGYDEWSILFAYRMKFSRLNGFSVTEQQAVDMRRKLDKVFKKDTPTLLFKSVKDLFSKLYLTTNNYNYGMAICANDLMQDSRIRGVVFNKIRSIYNGLFVPDDFDTVIRFSCLTDDENNRVISRNYKALSKYFENVSSQPGEPNVVDEVDTSKMIQFLRSPKRDFLNEERSLVPVEQVQLPKSTAGPNQRSLQALSAPDAAAGSNQQGLVVQSGPEPNAAAWSNQSRTTVQAWRLTNADAPMEGGISEDDDSDDDVGNIESLLIDSEPEEDDPTIWPALPSSSSYQPVTMGSLGRRPPPQSSAS